MNEQQKEYISKIKEAIDGISMRVYFKVKQHPLGGIYANFHFAEKEDEKTSDCGFSYDLNSDGDCNTILKTLAFIK